MNYLSLFSGIGGIDLGLDRAGWTCVGQVEIDPFCRCVLAKHWPEVSRHDDVRTAVAWWRSERRPRLDAVVGGFPCQPFSRSGARLGVADERWGWPWMGDVVRVLRPRFVVMENVAALLDDGDAFGCVLSDLATFGFDAQWSVLSACAVGAPHARERLFVVAYPDRVDGSAWLGSGSGQISPERRGESSWADPVDGFVAADGYGRGVADGVSAGLELARVAALGNAVVPQVAECIGRMIGYWDGS